MTLIPGDGIGPEISASVQKIFAAAHVSVSSSPAIIIKCLFIFVIAYVTMCVLTPQGL